MYAACLDLTEREAGPNAMIVTRWQVLDIDTQSRWGLRCRLTLAIQTTRERFGRQPAFETAQRPIGCLSSAKASRYIDSLTLDSKNLFRLKDWTCHNWMRVLSSRYRKREDT